MWQVSLLYVKFFCIFSLTSTRKKFVCFLNIVLTEKYFKFAGKMYHQVKRMAMDTKMAPTCANIFLGELEDTLLEGYHTTRIVWNIGK